MRVEIEIIDISKDGHGIGKHDGMTVFISGGNERAVVGDVVAAEIVKNRKKSLDAELREVVKPSALRGVPFCGAAGECGGCPLQNMTYEAQLGLKEKQVRDKLTRIAGVEEPKITAIKGMDVPFRYRNKARIAVSERGAGFFSAKSHKVVDCKTCLINSPPVEAVADVLRKYGKGVVSSAVVRIAFGTGEVMVILELLEGRHHADRKIIQGMDEAIAAISGGGYSLESTGGSGIRDSLGALRLEVSPLSFYQVNPVQAEDLYDKVLEYAALEGNDTVLDAYCGAGVIGLWCSPSAGRVVGIELSESAVRDANRNAVINGVVNARFICSRTEEELPALAKDGFAADVVILDPPRAGCKGEALEAAAKIGAKRIIYVSCDAATLARDIKILRGFGYEFIEAATFDMFPWSLNVEAVALLSKLKSTTSIEVKIDLDEMDLSKAESKATYDEIKKYVLDKFGFKVSQLYIAQVKRKHGIIERDNYNVGDGKSKVPQVPADKEKAIEEALRYFKMI